MHVLLFILPFLYHCYAIALTYDLHVPELAEL